MDCANCSKLQDRIEELEEIIIQLKQSAKVDDFDLNVFKIKKALNTTTTKASILLYLYMSNFPVHIDNIKYMFSRPETDLNVVKTHISYINKLIKDLYNIDHIIKCQFTMLTRNDTRYYIDDKYRYIIKDFIDPMPVA